MTRESSETWENVNLRERKATNLLLEGDDCIIIILIINIAASLFAQTQSWLTIPE